MLEFKVLSELLALVISFAISFELLVISCFNDAILTWRFEILELITDSEEEDLRTSSLILVSRFEFFLERLSINSLSASSAIVALETSSSRFDWTRAVSSVIFSVVSLNFSRR